MTDHVKIITITSDELERLIRNTWEQARHDAQLPEVMTRGDVATLLKVNEKTVNNYVNQRSLPAHKLGQEFRFRRSEVLEWLSAQTADRGAA